MHKLLTSLLFLLFSICAFSQERKKKAVFIIVDGIPADVVENVHTPSIDAIAAKGKYMRAYVGGGKDTYSQTPTISAVGYNSLLTGTWANKHNVWDNDIAAPNYNYKNIFRILKEQYPDKKTAVFSSWLDNRTKLVGDGLPAAGNVQVDYRFDGYELDTVNFPHDRERSFMHKIDERVTEEAVKCIRGKSPDLSWVYLEYTDDMGHRYGDSKQFYTAVELMDNQMGRIWNAIQFREKNYKEDWLIVITTDHGRSEKDGKGHGGQSARQRSTWIILNRPEINTYAHHFKPGIVDIMPTIARFMKLQLTGEQQREIDGIPLIGPVSIINPEYNLFQDKLDISWKAADTKGKIKLWVSSTNNFNTGGKDNYTLLAEVPVTAEHIVTDIKTLPSDFYKIVLEGTHNTVNCWMKPAK